ncbi:hypothetical protein RFI_27087 [Reticulomyxa filosa]|uniref:Uncharacterized protein n=1 Tax=Reticulomyxa filosa TaxID=46433 RepID=X6MB80_RETFI|nr:hypothetical protein RFI_27087 [Reticulomyxa filosa]|eukprot:ETO10290.1 hypothetical protein RFI_27087 [Reticulomyxa filosa]
MRPGITLQTLSRLYEQQFGEVLPVDTQLLNALVQCPQLLLMSRKETNEMVVFYCSEHILYVLSNIIEKAQSQQRQGRRRYVEKEKNEEDDNDDNVVAVEKLIKELEIYWNVDLGQVNVVAFLKQCNGVEVLERNSKGELYRNTMVRLVPVDQCTLSNSRWDNLAIRMRKDKQFAHARIDFFSLREAEAAMTLIKKKFYHPQIRVEIERSASALFLIKKNFIVVCRLTVENENANRPQLPTSASSNTRKTQWEQSSSLARTDDDRIKEVQDEKEEEEEIMEEEEEETEEKTEANVITEPKEKHPQEQMTATDIEQITANVYRLIATNDGRLLMSQIASKYKDMFNTPLNIGDDSKFFVKMERLLLLNWENEYVFVFFLTSQYAFYILFFDNVALFAVSCFFI